MVGPHGKAGVCRHHSMRAMWCGRVIVGVVHEPCGDALFKLHASGGKECGVVCVVVIGLAVASSMFHASYVASMEGDVVRDWSSVASPTSNTSDVDTLSRDVDRLRVRGGEPEVNKGVERKSCQVCVA